MRKSGEDLGATPKLMLKGGWECVETRGREDKRKVRQAGGSACVRAGGKKAWHVDEAFGVAAVPEPTSCRLVLVSAISISAVAGLWRT